HGIAALLLKARAEDPNVSLSAALAKASKALLGQPLEYSEERMLEILSPHYFIGVRMTLGGPAPRETQRAIVASRAALDADRAGWRGRRDGLAGAEQELKSSAQRL